MFDIENAGSAVNDQTLTVETSQFRPRTLEWALYYASQGMPVFPLRENSKEPAVTGGCHAATTDPQQIAAWFGGEQRFNIGIACEGFSVIDCDVKDGDGIAEWEVLAPGCEASAVQQTASGGRHYLFASVLRNTVKKVGRLIDTRGFGGYIVACPSEVDGRRWEWLKPPQGPLAPLPVSAYDALSRAAHEGKRDFAIREVDADFEPGTQHAYDYASAYVTALIRQGDIPVVGNRDDHAARVFLELRDRGVTEEQAAEIYGRFFEEAGGEPPDDFADLWEKVERFWRETDKVGCKLPLTASEQFGKYKHPEGLPLPPTAPTKRAVVVRGGSLKPRQIKWIWREWLARGKLHVLAGSKSTGKSTTGFGWAATITVGGAWPDGTRAPRGSVLVWSSEDDYQDTILPRFLAAGGDQSRLYHVSTVEDGNGGERPFDPVYDMPELINAMRDIPELVLVMIDPISVFAPSGKASDGGNADMRRALNPLVRAAMDLGVALLGVTHLTKGTQGRDPLERVLGTQGLTNLARVVLGAAKDEDDDQRRLIRLGSNIGPSGGGFDYKLERTTVKDEEGADMLTQKVVWGEFHSGTPKVLIDELSPPEGKGSPKTDAAEAWLMTKLDQAGALGCVVTELRKEAGAMAFSWPTVLKVREKHRETITTETRDGGKEWCWFLRGRKPAPEASPW
jgi:putative DNA primase/helicase